MASPVRYPGGVTNAAINSALANAPFLDPTIFHTWFDDFDNFEVDQWVVTATGAGTRAITTGKGGLLLLTNSAADDDNQFFQWSGDDLAGAIQTFKFVAGKETFFKCRFAVSDITQSDFIIGLQIIDTTPLAVSDGVYFRKDDGDSDLDFVVMKGSTATTTTVAGALTAATQTTLAFHYNGKTGAQGAIAFYVNEVLRGKSAVTNLPDTQELTISFGIQNGEAVAKTMTPDYIFVSEER